MYRDAQASRHRYKPTESKNKENEKMSNEPEIIKCKFAGDPEDEYCSKCDGIHVKEMGETYLAPDVCEAYEPCPPEPAEEAAETNENEALSQATPDPGAVPVQGITTVIRADSGLTREINGTYYKFTFSEERVIPEGADLEAEKAALWDAVNAEVDNQLESVLHS